MSTDLYQAFKRGATPKELYDIAIEKYEGEVKGFQIMLQRAESSIFAESVKNQNIAVWKKEIRKAKYNLTRARNLRRFWNERQIAKEMGN